MKQLIVLGLSLALIFLAALGGAAQGPAGAVVAVVSLDDQGQPRRQGLGVVIGKEGQVLTSASLLAQSRGGLIITTGGGLHLIKQVSRLDALQDLALLEVEAPGLAAAPLGNPGSLRAGDKVVIGSRQGKESLLKEARVSGLYPMSPRLVLLKIQPPDLEKLPGAPVFNERGEVVGLLHAFSRQPSAPEAGAFLFFLARDRGWWPEHGKVKEGRQTEPEPFSGDSQTEPWSHFWQGVAASLERQWPKAKEQFTLALAPPGRLPEASYGRGVARYHLKDYPGAVQDLEEAARGLPGYAMAFLWLGRSWERQGRRRSAQKAYQQAVAAAPNLSEAWFQLGLMAYQEGQLPQAQENFKKAQGNFPQAAERWWYLGNIALVQDRPEEALEAFQRAIASDAGLIQAYLEAGKLLLTLGRSQEAAQVLGQAVQRNPRDSLLHFYLALAHLSSWNNAGAWEEYFTLQKLNPELAARLVPLLERSR
ncbi:MAG: tetratricopeptide repeat protein [Thermodesulfobacteriota bacterium]